MRAATDIAWFPMYASFGREMKVKAELDRLGIVSYIPMEYRMSEKDGERHPILQPAIHNLIFVHSSQQKITELKITDKECQPLQYMTRSPLSAANKREILTIDEKSMQNFIRATETPSEKIKYLTITDFLYKEGRRVRIIDGNFAGVEGKIKRIHKNKVVVVMLENIAAVAITNLSPSYLEFID